MQVRQMDFVLQYARVDELIKMGLSTGEALLYKLLFELALINREEFGKCFPSLNAICEATGIKTRETAAKYIKKLERLGLIIVMRRTRETDKMQTSNEYIIVDLVESNKETQGVGSTGDQYKQPLRGIKKGSSNSIFEWEPNSELREYYKSKIGNEGFDHFVSNFKKQVNERYHYSDFDQGFRQFVDNKAERIAKKAQKIKTSKPSVKPLVNVAIEVPKADLSTEQEDLLTASKRLFENEPLVLNAIIKDIHKIDYNVVTTNIGSRIDLLRVKETRLSYLTAHKIEENKEHLANLIMPEKELV